MNSNEKLISEILNASKIINRYRSGRASFIEFDISFKDRIKEKIEILFNK
jgi:hypothetical protein